MLKKAVVVGLLIFLLSCAPKSTENINIQQQTITYDMTMKLTSPAFAHNGKIPSQYTCDGQNINPALTISDVPASAKSLVLIMDDPDAIKPANKVWDHWLVFNISPTLKTIPEGEEPSGVHGKGTSGNLKYMGPCPPDREHRYFFKLYALDAMLNLKEGVTKPEVEAAIQEHIVAQTELMGRYERVH